MDIVAPEWTIAGKSISTWAHGPLFRGGINITTGTAGRRRAICRTTSHYVLAGISTPIWHWRACDKAISGIKSKFGFKDAEIHTAWMMREYREQKAIPNFEKMSRAARRSAVNKIRTKRLLDLQKSGPRKKLNQTRKTFRQTDAYIHLTRNERRTAIREIADRIGGWGSARLFAECIDKVHFDPTRAHRGAAEEAFEGVVSRFDKYIHAIDSDNENSSYGLLIHDNNDTVAKKLTALTKQFHKRGTLWTDDTRIIETPLFVNSELTSMVQIADLCSYALRQYLENGEEDLLDRIFSRIDRRHGAAVGVRHFSDEKCECKLCEAH